MCLTTIQTMQPNPKRKSPPDLLFPSQYHQPSSETTPHPPPSKTKTKSPPNFNFPLIAPSSIIPKSIPQPPHYQKQSPLLRLPLEIRLQIYADVLAIHPIFHAHLAPVQPSPTNPIEIHKSISILRPIGYSSPSTSILTTTSHTQTISTSRGKIPTGLLASCKHVYEETHLLPFEKNTFNFINWFWSGVYASRQFTRGLRTWQAEGMRFVGVEVLTRDLISAGGPSVGNSVNGLDVGNGGLEVKTAKTDWQELCCLWKGVWGLKLAIKGSLSGISGVNPLPVGGMMVEGLFARSGEMPQMGFETGENGLLSVQCEWVSKGLCKMKYLKWLEVEIEDKDVGREEKVRFCAELEEVLKKARRDGKARWEGRTRVVFVEKCVVATGGSGKFMWFGGAPVGEEDD